MASLGSAAQENFMVVMVMEKGEISGQRLDEISLSD